ncbi:hypothetical protein B0H21DRAFT_711005 [Amylocystis lapponica]|nr:hypothetical protein B0H21DRAFT_711005 [Amylocystis lapponica]
MYFNHRELPPGAMRSGFRPTKPGERKVFVRRFDEDYNEWGPWIVGEIVAEKISRRLIGPALSYRVKFKDEVGQKHSEMFLPYLGEICSNPEELIPLENMVYIPILTTTVVRQWVDDRWTEYHVHIFNGPYIGLVMRSSHVCAFNVASAEAIEKSRDACIYDRLSNALEADSMVFLPVEPTKYLVLPVGHDWTTWDELKRQDLIKGDSENHERSRAAYLRSKMFDIYAEQDGSRPEWYG